MQNWTRTLSILAFAGLPVANAAEPHAGMLRYPDVSADHIVFSYANDLWLAPRDGGTATPLASPAGQELFPKFSPDGEHVVFQGNYDGGRDLYTMPINGGQPVRVTHRPGSEMPTDWTTGGDLVFFTTADRDGISAPRLYTVDHEGGLPSKLPVPYGGNGVVSEDGKWLAYTPNWRDMRTWKRYRGGLASDIWLMNLETKEAKQITDWEGTDTLPMWHKDTVYYVSDAGEEGRLNIWSYNTSTGETEQITKFDDFDVKFPSIGPGERGRGEIVFQLGSDLRLLDLRSGRSKVVEITIPGAKPKLRPHTIDAGRFLAGGDVSATGKRAVMEARGDIWTIPAENGPVRQLTDTSDAAERTPAWSPDGRWVAYFSDADGEYELYVTQSDGKGETRQVTDGNTTYFYAITWSPDSESVILQDKAGQLIHVDMETGDQKVLVKDPWGNRVSHDWSQDGRWLVYARGDAENLTNGAIWLYDFENDEHHRLTSGFFNDHDPAFSRKGDFLYYASSRRFTSPEYDFVGSTFIYDDTDVLIAVPLNSEVENPWLLKVDDEEWEEEEADDESDEAADEAADEDAEEGDDEAASDEADDDADEAEDNLDRDHPLFGKWEGTASGFAALGMPNDEIDYTLIIVVDNEGNITGESRAMGETNDLGDVVRFDEASGEYYSESSENGMTVISKATVNGDSMTGTWELKELGITGTWSMTRVTRELSDDEIGDAAESSGGKDGEVEPVEIDLEGFEARGMELPVSPGTFRSLATNDKGQLIYVRAGSPPAIKLIDATDDEPSEKTVLGGAAGYAISGDGKKLAVAGAGGFAIVDAAPGQSMSKTLRTTGLRKTVNPREEWGQLLRDAWRRHRDFFYVENMHGVDWDGVYEQYAAMLEDASTREDVSFIIGEMIGELNVGHAYYWGGDVESQPSTPVGLLGVEWELATETDEDGIEHEAYRIAKIYEGGAWDSDARNPLTVHGVDVEEGDYILRVNGMRMDTSKDPWAAFIGTAGQATTLTVASALTGDDETRNERDVTIKPLSNDFNLRYRDWVEENRAYVEEATSGKIGYIHVPNTGVPGQNELFRQFYGQLGKGALIIDERWNGGGQIPNRFIELLNRPRTNYWARRDGKDWAWPYDSHQGPKAMLINGNAGSGGDMFPWLFRHNGLGKLIGTRTWGGLVGISTVPSLIDGGYTAVPNFGFYELDGTWGIEGHGVDPDIEVIDDPELRAKGIDPQLDAAIEHLMTELETNAYEPAPRPRDPVRRGIGIDDEDK